MLPENLYLFKSLFRGRDEIFAIRWEKGGKSSYFPAYDYDPYLFRLHKIKGGTTQNFSDKKLLSLSDGQITKHLNGEHFIGIYPLLKDNTSWFIAADFDKANWIDECKSFLTYCHDQGLPAYLERSRSGKGGHVWLFFERPYPAAKSRKIIITLLERIGLFSSFDKNSSFDRLFPNQDSLSGKGFGNLIALPLNKLCTEQGNNCFINPETLEPYQDQWDFLNGIQRASVTQLDQLYEQILKTTGLQKDRRNQPTPETGKIKIELSQTVTITKSGLPLPLFNFLKDGLNFPSSEFVIKKKLGKSTWGSERYFNFIGETADLVIIPRGMAGSVLRFCRDNNIEYDFLDERKKIESVTFTMDVQLREHQKLAVTAAAKKDMGVIVAPPGTGKTIVGLKIIADKQQPALIIVHRKQLAEQWIERIQSFLGIPKNEIGSIGQGKGKVGKKITIALIQSLSRMLESEDQNGLTNKFGTIIVDECHHIPAESYRTIIGKLSSFYLYGLTANQNKIVKPSKIPVHKDPSEKQLKNILSGLGKDELADWITEWAKKDDKFRSIFLVRFSKPDDRIDIEKYARVLVNVNKHRGRKNRYDDFYDDLPDEEKAGELLHEMETNFSRTSVSEIISLCFAVFKVIAPSLYYVDDSDGAFSGLIEEAVGLLNTAIRQKEMRESIRKETFDLCMKHYNEDGMEIDGWDFSVLEIAGDLLKDAIEKKQLFAVLDDLERSNKGNYREERSVEIRKNVIEQFEGQEASEKYMETKIHLPDVRSQFVEKAISAKKYIRANSRSRKKRSSVRSLKPDFNGIINPASLILIISFSNGNRKS